MAFKLSLTSIAPTTDGSGMVRLTLVPIDAAGNPVAGAQLGDVLLAGADVATAMALNTVSLRAAEIKRLILAAQPGWSAAAVAAIDAANLLATAQATALEKLVPGLPYQFVL